eukprot:TRINITY_DN7050_c0_g2_i3.p1 TRINITY_DN7050_c0_g2~~TRINITY_DN7050_c0_g2_i3.p1  ORF type:complete len:146 (+),score=22.44 TRINITY_DN7050_c0_g2_i3:52-438(+)
MSSDKIIVEKDRTHNREQDMAQARRIFWTSGLRCAVPTAAILFGVTFLPGVRHRIATPLRFLLPSALFVPSFYYCGAEAERHHARQLYEEEHHLNGNTRDHRAITPVHIHRPANTDSKTQNSDSKDSK